MTVLQVKETGTGTVLPTEEGFYEEPGQEVNRGPEGGFKVSDQDASLQAIILPGSVCEVYENAVRKFVGIVRSRTRTRGVEGFFLEAKLTDLGYHLLRSTPCDPYTYSEAGKPLTDRDAVKVNPWEWRIFRSPFANTLDVDGNQVPVDGVPVDDAVHGLAGSRFVFTHRFEDDRLFRVSDLMGTPGAQVRTASDKYDTGADTKPVDVPSLQRLKGPTGYLTNSAKLRTIPLESGDPNVSAMGNVNDLSIVIVGKEDSALSAPTLEVTRNARAGSPTWQAVTLTRVANYNGSGLTAWTASNFNFAGAPSGGSIALRFTIGGTSLTETTRLYYFRLSCGLASLDTGLGGASVASYVDPAGGTLDKVWVDDDFEGLSRADALERVRTTTITDSGTNPSPHWDLWVDTSQILHFAHRRGSNLSTGTFTASLDDDSITVLKDEEFGDDLCFQVVAEGGGTGKGQYTISDKVEFSAGGLYAAALDPNAGAAYGRLARTHLFRDQGTSSRSELRRRARAYMRDRMAPRHFYELRFIPLSTPRAFVTGDSFITTDAALSLNIRLQVTALRIEWSGSSGHAWKVSLGHALNNPVTSMAGGASKSAFDKKAAILAGATKPAGGPGVYCDKDHYGRGSFVVPDGVEVDRVLLTIRTLPWQIYSRDGISGLAGANSGKDPFTLGLYEGSWTAPQASFTDFSNVFAVGGGPTAELDYILITLIAWNQNTGLHETTPEFRIVRNNGSFAGEVVASQNLSAPMRSVPVQNGAFGDGEDTIASMFMVVLYKTTAHPILASDTFKLQYKNTNGSWSDEANAYMTWFYEHQHAVPLTFGIWQYDGDGGTGDGNPVYGKVRFAIDPAVDSAGQPTQFSTDNHPDYIGDQAAPVTRTLDVTPYLRKQADGRVAAGEHEVMFQGLATTWAGNSARDNSKGLAMVAISARIVAAEANG